MEGTSSARWGPGGRFWRYAPSADEGNDGAYIHPSIHALHIPAIRPLISDNFLELLNDSSLDTFELFLHEFSHFWLSMTPMGRLLANSRHAIYLILFSLNERMVLHLPSWRIDGHDALTNLAQRLNSLIRSVNDEMLVVDEAVATAVTIANYRFLASIGLADEREERDAERSIIAEQIIALYGECGKKIWMLCERLISSSWFETTSPMTYARTFMLLLALGKHAFDLKDETLHYWWQTGLLAPSESPTVRLERVLNYFQCAETGLLNRAVSLFLQGIGLFKLSHSTRHDKGRIPDPFNEVVAALDFDADSVRFAHPVGQAVEYLYLGFTAKNQEDINALISGKRQRELYPAISNLSVILPLVSEEGGTRRCQYMVRFPIGRLAARFLSGELDIREMRKLVSTVEFRSSIKISPMTVMPASDEVMLLWNLELLLEQLINNQLGCLVDLNGLHCAVPKACPSKDSLLQVYEHVRTDKGRRLPSLPCRL